MEQNQEKESEKQTEEESKKEEQQQSEEIIKKSSSYQESEINEVKKTEDIIPVRFHLYNIYIINI